MLFFDDFIQEGVEQTGNCVCSTYYCAKLDHKLQQTHPVRIYLHSHPSDCVVKINGRHSSYLGVVVTVCVLKGFGSHVEGISVVCRDNINMIVRVVR